MKSISQTSQSTESQTRLTTVLSWAVVIAIAIFIFWMSAKDGTTLDENSGIFSLVKAWLSALAESFFGYPVDVSPVGHFIEYLAFGAALANALRNHIPLKRAAIYAVVLASAYGVTDEFHQLFVPQRSCDPADWAVDTIAAIIGSALMAALCAHRANKS